LAYHKVEAMHSSQKFPSLYSQLHKTPEKWSVVAASLSAPMAAVGIQNEARTVSAAVSKYGNLPEMKWAKERFSNRQFKTAFIDPQGGIIAAESFEFGADPLICVIPQQSNSAGYHLAFFDRTVNGGCLTVKAILWGDPVWEDAIKIHELLHYLRFLEHSPTAFAPSGSDLFVAEEVEAHMVESAVLNAGTQGRYSTTIKSVFNHHYSDSLADTVSSSAADIANQTDSLFGNSVTEEAASRAAQYDFELTRLWYQRQGDKDPAASAYKALTQYAN